jgi:hypothetical protein
MWQNLLPYLGAIVAFLVVFLPWELTALRKDRTHITLSEYVWNWEGKSKPKRLAVAGVLSAFSFWLVTHFLFGH